MSGKPARKQGSSPAKAIHVRMADEENALAVATSRIKIDHKAEKAMLQGKGGSIKNFAAKKRWKPKEKEGRPHVVNFQPHGGNPDPYYNPEAFPIVSIVTDAMPHVEGAAARRLPSQITVDTGAFRVKNIDTKLPWVNAILNGVASGDARYPDPFTLAKTVLIQYSSTESLNSASSSSNSSTATFDWVVSGLTKGTGVNTHMKPGLPSGNSYNFDWKSTNATWLDASASGGFYTRPNGVTIDIIPRMVGVAHTAKMFAFPVTPLHSSDLTSQTVTGWPSDPNAGLSAVQVSWGGREWELDATTKGVRLCCLPYDSRCFDFLLGSLERNSIGSQYACAWGGWVWWINGLSSADKVDIIINSVEEATPVTRAVSTQYGYPLSDRLTDSGARDLNLNKMKNMSDRGFSAYKLIDETLSFATQAWGIGKKIYSMIGSYAGGGAGIMAPNPNPNVLDAAMYGGEQLNSRTSSSNVSDNDMVVLPKCPTRR